jgi:hypothetical protein
VTGPLRIPDYQSRSDERGKAPTRHVLGFNPKLDHGRLRCLVSRDTQELKSFAPILPLAQYEAPYHFCEVGRSFNENFPATYRDHRPDDGRQP